MTAGKPTKRQLTGKHVLFALCAFFGVMFAANGAFVYFAYSTFNGIETRDAYRSGLNYNARLGEAERQAARGWKTKVTVDADTRALAVSLTGKDGYPVTGLQIEAEIGRPATDKFDRMTKLVEKKPGIYEAQMADATSGAWIVAFVANREAPEGPRMVYRHKERIWLAPNN